MKIPTFARRLLLLLAGLSGVMIVEGRSAALEDLKNLNPFKRTPAQPVTPSPSSQLAQQPAGGGSQPTGRLDPKGLALNVALELANNFLREPGLRKKLHGMRAQAAFEELENALETPSQSLPETLLKTVTAQLGSQQVNREELKRQIYDGLKEQAQEAASESMSSEAFLVLCESLKVQLADALQKRLLSQYKRNGPKFVLAVGQFKYATTGVLGFDIKIEDMLKRVVGRLIDVKEITDNFQIVQYDVMEAEKLIEKIGGNIGNWLREDNRNHMDLAVQDYHPADIFIVTGTLYEEVDQRSRRRTYTVVAEVKHPIKRHLVAMPEAKTVNYYHPTRHWLTEAQNEAIAPSAP